MGKRLLSSEQKKEWERSQREITLFLEHILLKIEWYYGDNRAPFQYPPKFSIDSQNEIVFRCDLYYEDSLGEIEPFHDINPIELSKKVNMFLEQNYGLSEPST